MTTKCMTSQKYFKPVPFILMTPATVRLPGESHVTWIASQNPSYFSVKKSQKAEDKFTLLHWMTK